MPHKNQILIDLIKTQKILYCLSVLSLILASFFAFLVPYIGKVVIDRLLVRPLPTSESDLIQDIMDFLGGNVYLADNLWISGGLIVLVTILSGLFMYIKDYLATQACEETVKSLRNRLYSHLHHLSNHYHTQVDSGDLLQRCTSDIDTLREFLTKQVMNIGRTLILVIIVVPLMLLQNVEMTLLSLVLVPVILSFAFRFFGKIKKQFQLVDEAEGELTTVTQENLTGIRVVRAFARQEFEMEKFDVRNKTYSDANYQLLVMLSKFWSYSDLLCMTQTGIVLIAGGWLAGQGIISIGTFFAFLTYTSMLIWPIRELGKDLSETGKAVIAIGRIQEVLNVPEEHADISNSSKHNEQALEHNLKGDIEFKNVSFAYEENKQVLNDLSFHIKAGQSIAIVGPTGAGKSTLIQLLLRLYSHQQGEILLDGLNINNIERKSLRQQIGTLLQEPFLFSRSLKENIRFGCKTASDEEVLIASKSAAVHHTIESFEKGYDTVIGERGVSLSGGQRQRVTLARALLKPSPILILDDTLSAVDSHTEQLILQALAEQKQRKQGKQTLLMITHRISCCQDVDNILVLENGRISQQGNHQALLQQSGFYQQLWDIQSGQKQDFLDESQHNNDANMQAPA